MLQISRQYLGVSIRQESKVAFQWLIPKKSPNCIREDLWHAALCLHIHCSSYNGCMHLRSSAKISFRERISSCPMWSIHLYFLAGLSTLLGKIPSYMSSWIASIHQSGCEYLRRLCWTMMRMKTMIEVFVTRFVWLKSIISITNLIIWK